MERNSEVKLISLEQPYKMKPGEFLHGKTHERIKLPTHLAGMIEGRSSLARLGLGVHITAPTVQTGFEGRLVLEMCNHGPFTLELKPRMKIAQLVLEHLSLPASGGYSGQYQGQK
jgi:dCTP deaminase